MNKVSQFEFKKTFRQATEAGIAFHWLRCEFNNCITGAVTEAIRTVYFPSALASCVESADQDKVSAFLVQSRRTFERWMDFAQEAQPLTKQCPNRVQVEFTLPIDDSISGRSLKWLLNQGARLEQEIIDAVILLYLPVSLWALGDTRRHFTLMRSWTNFAGWMDLPGYLSPFEVVSLPKPSFNLVASQKPVLEVQQPESFIALEEPPPEIPNPNSDPDMDLDTDTHEDDEPDDTPNLNLDYDF